MCLFQTVIVEIELKLHPTESLTDRLLCSQTLHFADVIRRYGADCRAVRAKFSMLDHPLADAG